MKILGIQKAFLLQITSLLKLLGILFTVYSLSTLEHPDLLLPLNLAHLVDNLLLSVRQVISNIFSHFDHFRGCLVIKIVNLFVIKVKNLMLYFQDKDQDLNQDEAIQW
jgi:hypothetical protein